MNETPLASAVEKGQVEIVRVLLAHGADPNLGSLLSFASARGYKAIVALLLEHGADPNRADSFFGTPWQAATENDHEDVVELLASRGAKAEARESSGRSLHELIERGAPPAAIRRELLAQIDPNGPDPTPFGSDTRFYSWRTPMHMVARTESRSYMDYAKNLLEFGATANGGDDSSAGPLAWAIISRKFDLAELLMQKGASREAALRAAVAEGLLDYHRTLLQRSADVNAVDENNESST